MGALEEVVSQDERIWILIIQKRPHGPLTREEVTVLLSQGVIKRNDLAMKLVPGQPKASSGWKILWQYPEFERRGSDATSTPVSREIDRRKVISEESIKSEISSKLPSELADLPLEDLAFHSPKSPMMGAHSEDVAQTNLSEIAMVESNESSTFRRVFGWRGASVVAVIGSVALLRVFLNSVGGGGERKETKTIEQAVDEPITRSSSLPTGTPLDSNAPVPKKIEASQTNRNLPEASPQRETRPLSRDIGNLPSSNERESDVAEENFDEESFDEETLKKRPKKKRRPAAEDVEVEEEVTPENEPESREDDEEND